MEKSVFKAVLNPPGWRKPRGYANLVKATAGTTLFAAGQGAFDAQGNLVGNGDICQQYDQIFSNIQELMAAGGARMTDIVRMTIYCTDRDAFFANGKECGQIFKKYFGGYCPASTFVEISRLFVDGMLLEIEVTAVV